VIEDNPANMELMTYLLKAHGYTSLTAMDGESGLALAARELPALIICDVHLPQLDGYGVVRVLKRTPSLRDIPAIAVTALAMVGDRDKLIDAGFDGYISKPIEPETFIGEIERFLPDTARFPQRTVEPGAGSPTT
jgi:CheY-like chemotaxis protein